MYVPEYQAKAILAQYGIAVPEGGLAQSAAEAEARAEALGAERFAVKAQILAGGRGVAGGVRFADSPGEAREAAAALLGTRLVTEQTGADGETVENVYVEAAVDVTHSVYLAFAVDERTASPTLIGSRTGGVEFERAARTDPDIVDTLRLPADGDLSKVDVAGFVGRLGIEGAAAQSTRALIEATVRAALATDALLVEINPLAVLADGAAIAVDANILIDDHALFRQPDIRTVSERAARDEHERVARDNEINFVRLPGNIGVVVNGAGLGLATHDMLVDAGGAPANFMDIRTTATSLQIAQGVRLLLGNPAVKVVLVNVHGGGMTVCDTVAEGINFAYARSDRKLPIVFRAAGQNASWARTIMKDRRLPYENADDIGTAVARAVGIAGQGRA